MDDKRFDQIARALGGVTGRRQAVKSIFGGAVATGIGALGLAEAAAKNKGKGKHHGRKSNNAGAAGNCRPEGHPCKTEPNACCAGLICGSTPNSGSDIRCCTENTQNCEPICGSGGACGSDEVCCNDACVTGVCCTDTDCPQGDTCNSDHQCVPSGNCDPPCSSDETCCGGTCVTCPTGGVCSGTTCQCPSGQTECSGACVDTQTDPNNCGECGNVCPSGDTCVAGNCTAGGGCTSDADCPPDGLCLIDGTCFFPSTCPAGETNLACCIDAVKKACKHQGAHQPGHGAGGRKCRRKGKRRCNANFGNT